ncbi:MAG: SGNH/GDSL hydrolase family protein [Candidatus Eisenbacteria bacterium]|nr:SGNH/GDSL hydrolase family protein [Candidatus Eisenbacteria bacterium]
MTAVGRWPRLAGWAGLLLLAATVAMLARPSRPDRREVLGRYSLEYAALIGATAIAGAWWSGGFARPGTPWAGGAGVTFRALCEAGVMILFVFGVSEGLCRLAARPLAHFTGGPALVRDYPKATVNSHGLRDPERPFAKPAGAFRMLTLGDSFMFGHGVADDSTCARILERTFNARGGTPVEVVNASHIGFNSAQERAMLDTLGLRFHPDLLMLAYVLNDPEEKPLAYPSLLPGSLGMAMEWSSFYYLLRAIAFRALVAAGKMPEYPAYIRAMFDPSLASWQRHRAALRGIVADAASAGVRVVAVVWPYADKGHAFTPYGFAREQAMAVAALREAGAETLDLYPVFAHDRYEDLALTDADSHPNARSHRLAAAAITQFLDAHGLVPGRAPVAAHAATTATAAAR